MSGRTIGRMMAWLGAAALLLYLAVLTALFLGQSRILYPGWSRGVRAVAYDTARFRRVATVTEDGLAGRLLYAPPAPGKPVILFFHGNGDSVAGAAQAVMPLVVAGYGAVLPEYRGYDGLPGTPSEQGLYRDARAARRWLTAQGVPPADTIVMGYSLGTGVAAEMATEERPRALVLVAPFASIATAARMHFPWLPAGLLVTERFATIDKIGRIDCPLLLLHGAADATVPVASSRLLAAVRPDARLVVLAGVGHEIAWTPAAQRVVADWLARLPAPAPAPARKGAASPDG